MKIFNFLIVLAALQIGQTDARNGCNAKTCHKCVHIIKNSMGGRSMEICRRFLMNPCCETAMTKNRRLF